VREHGKGAKGNGKAAAELPLKVAAVDVGSNAIRFLAARFEEPRSFGVLAAERYPLRLGHDVFLSGRLTREAMDGCVTTLGAIAEQLRELGVTHRRAVATSAIRESANGDKLIERVRRETGLELEVISGSEEARLVHLAAAQRMRLGQERWILVDVGGGSVEVSLADDGGVLWSESHTMGSVRLLEELSGAGEEPGRFGRLLEEYVATLRVPAATRQRRPAGLIATGGNVEALARLAGAVPDDGGVAELSLAALRNLIETLAKLSFRQRVEQLGLREDRADVILPAAMVYERLATLAEVTTIHVPHVGIREGVVLDLVADLTGKRARVDRKLQEVLASAITLGRRFLFDEGHATRVGELSLSLFDQLKPLHGLGDADRRMLAAAAVLHDIGAFVSYKRHHRHSLYLIANSELPGFSPGEMRLVANVARYHRKGEPADDHEEFASLAAEEQGRVRRLAPLLRMADALDREHQGTVEAVRATVRDKELRLRLVGRGDLLLEKWALKRKAEFFTREYGLKVRVEGAEA
jgi:exopolyphosphatase/guanosine-5'-triphosphate,3'-diphosphate pyrophosphatase